jgi:hypothetical protein
VFKRSRPAPKRSLLLIRDSACHTESHFFQSRDPAGTLSLHSLGGLFEEMLERVHPPRGNKSQEDSDLLRVYYRALRRILYPSQVRGERTECKFCDPAILWDGRKWNIWPELRDTRHPTVTPANSVAVDYPGFLGYGNLCGTGGRERSWD